MAARTLAAATPHAGAQLGRTCHRRTHRGGTLAPGPCRPADRRHRCGRRPEKRLRSGGAGPRRHRCAARLLSEHKDAWSGTHIALFQPAEETASGVLSMMQDGLTSKVPRPDVALAQHVIPVEAGLIGTTPGPVLSAGDSIKVTVHGRGGHGSMPHNAVDPVVLAASIVLRL